MHSPMRTMALRRPEGSREILRTYPTAYDITRLKSMGLFQIERYDARQAAVG